MVLAQLLLVNKDNLNYTWKFHFYLILAARLFHSHKYIIKPIMAVRPASLTSSISRFRSGGGNRPTVNKLNKNPAWRIVVEWKASLENKYIFHRLVSTQTRNSDSAGLELSHFRNVSTLSHTADQFKHEGYTRNLNQRLFKIYAMHPVMLQFREYWSGNNSISGCVHRHHTGKRIWILQ